MLGDQFHLKDELCQASDLCVVQTTAATTSSATGPRTMPSCFESHHHQVTLPLVSTTGEPESHQHLISSQVNYQTSGHAIRYYQPLVDHYPLNRYSSLNQKRESVITFSSNHSVNSHSHHSGHHLKSAYLDSLDLEEDKPRIGSPSTTGNGNGNGSHSHKVNKYKANQVMIDGIPFTIDQIVCICQVLQKSDIHKLEKFVYNLPLDSKLSKNELILRARSIAAYHSGNYKEVYDILENNNFNMKYHQELQNLWNNAHYKEHELKRGHPPGAVEKYRIRKKFQFPRTIWDGEEYVYCFKEKNRRVLKEFYLKCNLPTQEDKLKLSSQTQLTVVQISNWFKNRRQRDRQPNHEQDKISSDAHSNVTNDSSSPATPSPPISSMTATSQSFSVSESVAVATAISQQQQQQHHHHHGPMSSLSPEENSFCLLGGHSQPPSAHRSYYFLPQ